MGPTRDYDLCDRAVRPRTCKPPAYAESIDGGHVRNAGSLGNTQTGKQRSATLDPTTPRSASSGRESAYGSFPCDLLQNSIRGRLHERQDSKSIPEARRDNVDA